MSSTYYDMQWQSPVRQPSWDQPPPSRSGASSTVSREENTAFGPQFEEVERAIDNLTKSGKLFAGPRRDNMAMGGGPTRGFPEFDPRMGGSSRHPSLDFDPLRSQSAGGLQNFYQNARYQPRGNEPDQMQQAKRRMAAQRERDLRNYHQEQQYNRIGLNTQGKVERSGSPNTMNEDERRDLIARQHRALYGAEPSFYEGNNTFSDDTQTPRPANQAPTAGGARGPSPLTYNSFGAPEQQTQNNATEEGAKGPSPKPSGTRSRSNSNSSPASNNQNFSLFDPAAAQQSSRTSTSSPGGSPPRANKNAAAPAPIGTRPTQAANPALNKRNTPPASSPLSYGFAPNEGGQGERASSAASNPTSNQKENMTGSMNWGSSSGVWGKSSLGGVQASVWG